MGHPYVHHARHREIKICQRSVFLELFASRIDDPQADIDSIYFIVPVLVSSGLSERNVVEDRGKITVNYQGQSYTIEFDKNSTFIMGKDLFANRNGIYRKLTMRIPGNHLQVNLRLE